MSRKVLTIGEKAPAFALQDRDEKMVALKDFAGQWVVLYFYPKDNTPGCTTEACEFTAEIKAFENLGAAVLGVSPDSPQSHRNFADKHRLKVRLLSDPEHKVLAAYGAWGDKTMYGRKVTGVIRSTVLIDPKGRIAFAWPTAKAGGHAAVVKETLAALQKA